MKNFRNHKVLLLSNVISPYRVPVFNHLAQKNNFSFVFLRGMLKNLKLKVYWNEIKFDYQILKGTEIFFPRKEFTLHLNIGFLRLLMKEKPDVIISMGYSYIESIIALIYAKLKNKKFILWSGSTLNSSESKSKVVHKMKKTMITRCDSFLTYGSDAADYLIHYGAAEEKIVVGCNTVNVDYFIKRSLQAALQKEKVKKEKQYPAKLILFCGQLILRKNLDALLKAFSRISQDDLGLIILGDGPLKNKYIDQCRQKKLKNVFFEGFCPMEDLPAYYAISDVFVMPSLREVWGLVLNEAMACGLPVLCSNKAGAARDLVRDGINGHTFNPEDVNELKNKLLILLNDEEKRKKMGQNSRRIVKDYTPEKYAEDLLKTIKLVN